MALQIPSGLITAVSGGGVVSGTTQPLYTYPIPVVIVGANGASASGNHSITDTSGVLNVSLNSGAAISISGDIVLVVSGGTIQVSGTVSAGILSGQISIQSGSLSVSSGAISVVSGSITINSGSIAAGITSGAVSIQSGSVSISSGNITVSTSGTGGGVVIGVSGVTALLAETTANPNLRVGIFQAGTGPVSIENSALGGGIISNNLPGLRTNSIAFLDNAASFSSMRSAHAVSGGTTSGLGLLVTEGMIFDVSGAAHRQITNAGASGSQTVAAGLYYQYRLVSGAVVVNVQSGAAVLHAINVNSWVSGGQIEIRDSMSGLVGSILGAQQIDDVGTVASQYLVPQGMVYDCLMMSGIVISTSGAAMNVTILYKNPP